MEGDFITEEKSNAAIQKRFYGILAILVAVGFVLSSMLAFPVLKEGFGLDDSGASDRGGGDTVTDAMDEGTEVAGEEETVSYYPVDHTTVSVPDLVTEANPEGSLVEDEVTGEMLINPEPNLYVTPKEWDSNGMRRVTPGTLDWKYDTDEGEEISTPGLVDLNGDGTYEVVFASHGDAIYALSSSGSKRWVNSENTIEQADDGHFGNLDFEPPPIFSSVTPADIDGSSDPELLIGVEDGIVCLNADGSTHWKKGLTDGYYFSTPTVTDLEGEYTGDKDDLEVILGSDGTDRNAWMEAFHVDGGSIFREQVTSGGEPALLASSPVSQDLDGSFYDPEDDPPEPEEETWHELELGSHDHGMRIYGYGGAQSGGEPDYNEITPSNLAGHQTYATSAVGNFTMMNNNAPEAYEIIVGSCEGYQVTWESWGGQIYSYDGDGTELWRISTGGSKAAVMSSVAVADIQMAELDESEEEIQYEIFVGCDSGKLFALDADYRQELWGYTTGGRMMSSPAICNIDSDDELEVIVGSDDGYIYAFDGDPSDMIDEGIADSGGASGAYDILWKYNTGGSGVGISSAVVGDIDNDNVLEVVIGDIDGTVYCIEAGTSSRGQIDWPMFHYDLNKTGFYNPRIQFGVDLSPTLMEGGPDSMVKSVQPGEEVYYNVTIKNTGSGVGTAAVDTFFLSIEGEENNPGWKAEFFSGLLTNTLGEHYITLEVDQVQDFIMKVSAPFEGSIGEVAQFNITANSTNDPFIKDVLITSTQLEVNLDLELEFTKPVAIVNDPTNPWNGEKWAKVDPGGEYIATMELKNRGNLNDSYELRLIGVVEGWEVTFVASQTDTYGTNLTAPIFEGEHSSEVISLRIVVPFDAQAGESATLVVKAVSVKSKFLLTPGDDSDWIEDEDFCVIEAGATNELQLEVVDPLQYVDPGGTSVFILYVTNRGNRQMTVEIDDQGLEGRDDEDDWEIEYEDEMFIADGQKKELRVYVTAPYDARAELRLPLTISALDAENPNIFKTVGISTIVKHMYSINATVYPEFKTANPGDLITYRLEVENEGNGEDIVTPSPHAIIKGWEAWFTPQGQGQQEKQIEYPMSYNEMVNISMKLQVPEETLTGQYTTVVNLTGGGALNSVFVSVVTSVNQTYNLNVVSAAENSTDSPSHLVNVTMDPGSTIIQRVVVTNYANGPDEIEFTAELDEDLKADGWRSTIGAISNTGDYTPLKEETDFTLPLEITNKGDGINYLPNKNSSSEDTIIFTLGVEESAWVQVVISAPETANDLDEVDVEIKAESSSLYEDTSDNSVIVRINIDLSDLKFTTQRMEYPSDMEEGRIYTVKAQVVNVGDIEAQDFWVTFYVDDDEVDKVFISRLIPGRTQVTAFTWSAESGQHKFKMIVDSEETVIESNEENNLLFAGKDQNQPTNVKVKEDETLSGSNALNPAVVSVLFIILLILLAIALAYITKKYRDLTKENQ